MKLAEKNRSSSGGRRSSGSIAFVISDFGSGGAQRVATLLLEAWAQEGRRVHLITWQGPEGDFFHPPAGLPRTVIGENRPSPHVLGAILANIRRILRLRRALRKARADVAISFITPANILLILASRGLSVRTIVSERNDPTRQNFSLAWRMLRRITYRYADAVTANSVHAVNAMASYVPSRKLAAIPNPVRLPKQAAEPRLPRTILNVGRLVPHKGQHLIVEALGRIGPAGNGWHVAIVGEGPQHSAIADLASRRLCGRVELAGPTSDIASRYRSAAIFVLPSYYEGMPNALLEAMAYGLPCIVSSTLPGAREHLEDGVHGLVFRSGDADHLAECLARLIGDAGLRARVGLAARERMKLLDPARVLESWDRVLSP